MRAATLVAVVGIAAALPARAVDCPYDPATHRTAQSIRAEVSRIAEIVAPSSQAGGKRRSITSPPISYPEPRNFIDIHILDVMKRAGIAPAHPSTDTEFLRRVTIDLTGRIPTSAETRAFIGDTSADKRDRAIDRLLASNDFNDRWTLWYSDLVQNVFLATAIGTGVAGLGRDSFYRWMRDSFAQNKPYDAMVRETLSGSGDSGSLGPPNYARRQLQGNGPKQDTYDNFVTQSGAQFLGMPLMCISCHDGRGHLELVNLGLAHMKRRQLWEMASFFTRTTVTTFVADNIPGGGYKLNTKIGNKSARAPLEGESDTVMPRYYLGGTPGDNEVWRVAYARYLTADRQFARAAVNYIWKELFGLAVVEPVDGFDLERLETQATHPKLLEDLADAFIASGYDLRALMRLMVQSNTYQLSSRYEVGAWNEKYTPYFARHYPRRLLAEVLLDAIDQATGITFEVNTNTLGKITRAVALPDMYLPGTQLSDLQFLTDFGQGNRDNVERSNSPSLIQALTVMNSLTLIRGTRRSLPTNIAAILKGTNDPDVICDQLYVATLSRFPTSEERSIATQYLRGGKIEDRAEDLQFVLLNKLEFLFN